MTFEDLLKDIKQKKFAPVYFFHGPEIYYIDALIQAIEDNGLNEMEKAFNLTMVYGKDVNSGSLMDVCLRLPMMAERQLVFLKEAQYMDKIEGLEPYLKNPNPQTILVVCYKKDKTEKSVEKLFKQAVIFEAAAIKEKELPQWINKYLAGHKSKINEKALQMLVEFLGSDLSKISNELDKLIINKGEGASIDETDVEKNIGISKDYNIFEFQKALAGRQKQKVYQIIDYFSNNQKAAPITMVTSILYKSYTELYQVKAGMSLSQGDLAAAMGLSEKQLWLIKEPMALAKNYTIDQIERCLEILNEYNLKEKGLGSSGSVGYEQLMKEMAYKLMM